MSSKLFGRVIQVISGPVKMSNADLDIEFEIPFDDDLTPNLGTIEVYNLSNTTINQLKKKQKISLVAGYVGDKGLIFDGEIQNVHSVRTGADRLTTIKVIDTVNYSTTRTIKRAYKKGITAEAIIRDLARIIGLKIAVLKLPNNKSYKKGHSVKGAALKELQNVAVDCGASSYVNKGQAYIRSLKEGDNHNFELSASTGLIGSPEFFEEERNNRTVKGYKAKSLLQYRINTASIIKLRSVEVKATVRVYKGKHIAKGDSFYTELEAIA